MQQRPLSCSVSAMRKRGNKGGRNRTIKGEWPLTGILKKNIRTDWKAKTKMVLLLAFTEKHDSLREWKPFASKKKERDMLLLLCLGNVGANIKRDEEKYKNLLAKKQHRQNRHVKTYRSAQFRTNCDSRPSVVSTFKCQAFPISMGLLTWWHKDYIAFRFPMEKRYLAREVMTHCRHIPSPQRHALHVRNEKKGMMCTKKKR